VCAWRERLIGVLSNLAEHNKYLILFVERITSSTRAKNVMQLERAPDRVPSNLAEKMQQKCSTKCHVAGESA
jgi:hypothetical protein